MNRTTFLIHPLPPFRLDLTVWALRRRPQNLIDRWDGTTYRRVVVVNDNAFEITVTEIARQRRSLLRVTVDRGELDRGTKQAIKQGVVNALGLSADLRGFYRLAAPDPKLALLVARFCGVKPPRFFSVFEGVVNGIACQQLSLSVGILLLNRLAQNFGLTVRQENSLAHAFPRPQDLADLKIQTIRKLGFNFQKARALIEVSRAIADQQLDLEGLQLASDQEALEQLMKLRGVGRWTAELTMLRGMGRWHVFPVDDLGARKGLAAWLRLRKPLDALRTERLVARWEPYGGLIYFHMLMNGLDKAGYLNCAQEARSFISA